MAGGAGGPGRWHAEDVFSRAYCMRQANFVEIAVEWLRKSVKYLWEKLLNWFYLTSPSHVTEKGLLLTPPPLVHLIYGRFRSRGDNL